MKRIPHYYIDRATGQSRLEHLVADRTIRWLYADTREHAPTMFRLLTSAWASRLCAALNYDIPLTAGCLGPLGVVSDVLNGSDEFLEDPRNFKSLRQWFERKIKYWDCRPMPEEAGAVVSPADARVIVGSWQEHNTLFIKDKFFDCEELLGAAKHDWLQAFRGGSYAVFRLTPDKYHYNHAPVSGIIRDYYEIQGAYHSCNPGAVVAMVTPFSKNRRVVTVIDTDCTGGTGVGLVVMIEVVALMIGDIVQCYSAERYDDPTDLFPGMLLEKGQPKSLYRPGSSTTVVLMQAGRCRFCEDLAANQLRTDISSRFSAGFGQPLVETDVNVRSAIAWQCK